MQYFLDRYEAGEILAKQLIRYRESNSVVLALSQSSIVVAEPIAKQLHLPMGMLVSVEIKLPWDKSPVMGAVDIAGEYTPNQSMHTGVREEFEGEYHSHLDQERMHATRDINMMHVSNTVNRNHLNRKTIILVSDGLSDVVQLGEALTYLKPVTVQRLLVAVPVATVDVIDYLHIHCDEIHCLDVKGNYISTDHYYENNRIPEYEDLMNLLLQYDTMA